MLISPAYAQNIKPKMATEIPPEITTPDRVETRLGTLNFFDGVPDKATCETVYDNLDFMRAVEVFLNTMAAASTHANLVGWRSVGCDNHTVLIQTPDGYFVATPRTFNMAVGLRGFTVKGDTRPADEAFHNQFKMYPLAQAGNPPPTKIINGSGLYLNTIHANTVKFYDEINQVVQEEPTSAVDPEIAGQLAAIGIVKGKPFAPDERMKKILTEAAAVGNATARAIVFRARSDDFYFYPGKSNWRPIFVGGSYLFMHNDAALLDARINFFYQATGVSPAMAAAPV